MQVRLSIKLVKMKIQTAKKFLQRLNEQIKKKMKEKPWINRKAHVSKRITEVQRRKINYQYVNKCQKRREIITYLYELNQELNRLIEIRDHQDQEINRRRLEKEKREALKEAKRTLNLYPLSTEKEIKVKPNVCTFFINKTDNIKIANVDLMKRTIKDWADIYHMNLVDDYNKYYLIGEYNFAWLMANKIRYSLKTDELAEQWELRIQLLYLDLINNSSVSEKETLNERFILPTFFKNKMKNLNLSV